MRNVLFRGFLDQLSILQKFLAILLHARDQEDCFTRMQKKALVFETINLLATTRLIPPPFPPKNHLIPPKITTSPFPSPFPRR